MSFLSLGAYLAEAGFRVVYRGRRKDLQRWGFEKEIYWPTSTVVFAVWGVVQVVVGLVTSFFFLIIAYVIAERPSADSPFERADLFTGTHFEATLGIILFAVYAGVMWKIYRASNALEKVKALTQLPSIFQERFKDSEILSMYESLRDAPAWYWEEYISLPDDEVNEKTNQKYRRRAVPFRHNRSRPHNTFIVIGTIVLIVLAAIAALPVILPTIARILNL